MLWDGDGWENSRYPRQILVIQTLIVKIVIESFSRAAEMDSVFEVILEVGMKEVEYFI